MQSVVATQVHFREKWQEKAKIIFLHFCHRSFFFMGRE
jgi:hypothetical protein